MKSLNYYQHISDFCPVCHKPGTYIGDIPEGADPSNYVCTCHKNTLYAQGAMPAGGYGWICPRCNRVNAPFVKQCDCKDVPGLRTTSGD